MINKTIYNEEEFENADILYSQYPNVYMYETKKLKATDGEVIGRSYHYKDYTEEQLDQINENALKAKINRGRSECFDIINRGKLWYDSLTTTQITELKTWYQEWLDIPDKPLDYIPDKPIWIK